jgi:transposase
MMGVHQPQVELFSYKVNLDKRVRADHPLRRVVAEIDFAFIRAEVATRYGQNGHVSIDPAILLKMMFLLFFDDLASERELMKIIPERLDYLWFLGYGLDDQIPDHSVLSKARARWGKEAFEKFFTRTVGQCVGAGLVDGRKLHMDSSLIDANASKDSILRSCPELISALKAAYQAQESKLEDSSTPNAYEPINDSLMSTSDPDASITRKGPEPARPRYHHHRAVDDAHGVITAVETTPGSIAENKKLLTLIDQHEANTHAIVETAVADRKYGTAENYLACDQRNIRAHIDTFLTHRKNEALGIIPESEFKYQPDKDTYLCPAGKELIPRRLNVTRRTMEYYVPGRACLKCELREKCTRSKTGRTLQRHEHQEILDNAKAQAHSSRGRRDRKRRQTLMEGSFADAANNHGFKRSRWRRLWRQEVQDWLVAGIQNIRTLLKAAKRSGRAAASIIAVEFTGPKRPLWILTDQNTGRRSGDILLKTFAAFTSRRWFEAKPGGTLLVHRVWATRPCTATPLAAQIRPRWPRESGSGDLAAIFVEHGGVELAKPAFVFLGVCSHIDAVGGERRRALLHGIPIKGHFCSGWRKRARLASTKGSDNH